MVYNLLLIAILLIVAILGHCVMFTCLDLTNGSYPRLPSPLWKGLNVH